jgi:hypothetical protein
MATFIIVNTSSGVSPLIDENTYMFILSLSENKEY